MDFTSLLLKEGPRERLATSGLDTLTDSELLALILATGSKSSNALSLAQSILTEFRNDLNELATAELSDLIMHSGIGEAKAARICATFELGRRRERANFEVKTKISSSRDVYNVMAGNLKDKCYEEFWMLVLNRSNHITRQLKISEGSISGTVADPKKIYKFALQFKASSLVFLHNHPSGNLKPSQSDIQLTDKLKDAGKLLDIEVLDHLIIAQSGYYSFADEGLL